ncbi:PD-(D/E)XK motif protein [Nocardia sp. NPDC004068]|uniref:PD-(D/E)XK motif protein n=1 Tax=Nocardia sp. NPDC004068 TaxID=3364303 RepID=UPI0036C0C290
MKSDYRQTIEDQWMMLSSTPLRSPSAMRVSDLPVKTSNGRVAACVDPNNFRHLLVPIKSHQVIREGIDGPVLNLSRRPLETESTYQVYADLACLAPDFNGIFATFCAAALEEIEVFEHSPLKGLYRALDKWRMLFQRSGAPLGPEQVAGLFGELSVLCFLLETNPSAHHWWRGPLGNCHDFSTGGSAIEVKTSLVPKGRRVRIHGLDQLDPPAGGELLLTSLRVEPAVDGPSLETMIDRALERADDESAVLGLLALAGYHRADADHYRDKRFRVVEQRWYRVEGTFPRLTETMLEAASIPVVVHDVEYTIDLSGETPAPLEDDEVARYVHRMAEEPE